MSQKMFWGITAQKKRIARVCKTFRKETFMGGISYGNWEYALSIKIRSGKLRIFR